MNLFDKIENKIGYLKFRTNWHKHPWLSKLFCYLGRHDYEGIGYEVLSNDRFDVAIKLQCFYCEHNKQSLLK